MVTPTINLGEESTFIQILVCLIFLRERSGVFTLQLFVRKLQKVVALKILNTKTSWQRIDYFHVSLRLVLEALFVQFEPESVRHLLIKERVKHISMHTCLVLLFLDYINVY